ncbi:MAG: putative manganese-dependent inorganic diphosphatase [Verrucomicrobiota bacterium]
MAEKPVYIIGHRNPDADAICSAIAYEAFKRESGETRFKAARCGNSNKRIDAILGKFEVNLPPLITDVTPKIADIMITQVLKARTDSTCAEALDLIDEFDVRSLPVVDDDNRVQGIVSIFQLGEFFIPKPRETKQMRKVVTSISAIISALKARVVHTIDAEIDEDLYVRVGAMNLQSFGGFHRNEDIPASKSIIVVGDRHDIQEKSINLGVRLLIITGDLEIERHIIDLARERGVSLIISPFDSATTSWIVRSATRLSRVIDDRFMTFHADETVESVRRKVQQNNIPSYFVVDDEDRLIGIFSRTDLLKPVGKELVLVDHNEASQAVKGVRDAKIIEIVDHHRLGNLPSDQPILFMNVPVGSTCTIIANMFQRHNITPTPNIAGIMMSGIISDTLNLRGPTTTPKDRKILRWLAAIAGITADELADLIFSSGSVILSQAPEQVVRSDCKVYIEGDTRYSVAQVEELGFDNYWDHAEALDEALENFRNQEGLFMAVMLITDINLQDSLIVLSASEEVLESITYPKAKAGYDNIFDLHGIVSRKKQLIPYLTTFLQGLGMNA